MTMKAYLTLDYELYMGVSGTVEKCLIEPMRHFEEVLDRNHVKPTIFVDAAYLMQLKKLGEEHSALKDDFNKVYDHISSMSAKGYSIQLHLHPQWYYSTYENGEWQIDKEHYSLRDMPFVQAESYIKQSIKVLTDITKKEVSAFRAGGYSLPDDFACLGNNGITTDSSVLPDTYQMSRYQKYNYKGCPQKTDWRFDGYPSKETENGKYHEIAISMAPIGILPYLYLRFFRCRHHLQYSNDSWGDGSSVNEVDNSSRWKRLAKKVGRAHLVASVDKLSVFNLERVLRWCRRHLKGDKFVVIGHPKNISPNSIHLFEEFVKHNELEWTTM